jgi:hypothetical protein
MCIGETVGRKERSLGEYNLATAAGSLVCSASFHNLKLALATSRLARLYIDTEARPGVSLAIFEPPWPAGRTDEWWCEIFQAPSSQRHMYEKRATTGARSLPCPRSKVYIPECRYALPFS